MGSLKRILLADDSERDIELALEALAVYKLANMVEVVRDGAEALDYLLHQGQYENRSSGQPSVVLLDLKMPRMNGLEALRLIKSNPVLKKIPVVMMTSSREQQDLSQSYELGVNSFVVKPVVFKDFMSTVAQLGIYWTLINECSQSFSQG